MQQQVIELSRRLLAARPADFERQLSAGLRAAAEVAEAQRIHLSVFTGRAGARAAYDWIGESHAARAPVRTPHDQTRFSWIARQVGRGQPVFVSRVAELPPEAEAERREFEQRGVTSVLTLPIHPGEAVIGYLILEYYEREHAWSEAEVAQLRLMGDLFASAVRRHRAEVALRASEARFRALAENAPGMVSEMGPDGRLLWVGASVREVLGYEPEALLGRTGTELVHDEDRERVVEGFRGLLDGAATAEATYRALHRDGSWRWLHCVANTFHNASGELRAVVLGRDVTAERELERALRESQSQLLQAQKMEAVGRLAGGIAHDFNNLLMVVAGNTEQLLHDEKLAPESAEAANSIHEAVERAASLTRQLLSFSRRQMVAPRALALNEVVRSVESLLARLLGEHIELVVELPAETGYVRADRTQLEQVLINLAVNARDAMPEGGRLELRVSRREVGPETARRLGLPAPGPCHVIEVRDTGMGMEPGISERVFEPFFTTKEPGQGTGLGLSIAYSVVRQAAGALELETRAGRGTAVRIFLPARAPEALAPAPAPVASTPDAGGHVLLVEDEDAVRGLIARLLDAAGYRVSEARDPEQALARLGADAPAPDLLITDVVMPRLSGPELVRRLRQRWPGLPVLFISGYPRHRGSAGSLVLPEGGFLQKPFAREALLARVREQLAPSPPRPAKAAG